MAAEKRKERNMSQSKILIPYPSATVNHTGERAGVFSVVALTTVDCSYRSGGGSDAQLYFLFCLTLVATHDGNFLTGREVGHETQVSLNFKPHSALLWGFESPPQIPASEFGVLLWAGSPTLLRSLAEACLCLLRLLTTPQGRAPAALQT